MAEVVLHNVSKRFGETQAVADMSLTVKDGAFVVLLGPTGAGKTTTLRLVAGLEKADSGTIGIAGHDMSGVPPAGRDVAFVFQQYSLYPHLSVFDNLAFPLRSPTRRQSEDAVRARVGAVAEMLHIQHKLENRATQLSGGEMQRVAIGRALVREPAVFLMDEPLSSLDAKLRAELRLELKRIQQELGATILYVTHDQIEAMTMATEIGVLSEGVLVQFGDPHTIYRDPDDVYVATRLGTPTINLIPAATFTGHPCPDGTRFIGARTEHIHIARQSNGGTPAVVERVERLGDQTHLHLKAAGEPLSVLVDPHDPVSEGASVDLTLTDPLYFDADGYRIRTAPVTT